MRWTHVTAGFVFLLLSGCSASGSRQDVPCELLRAGDVVFRRGNGTKSQAVLYADREGMYSHTGIVVQLTDSTLRIVHAEPDKTCGDSLKLETLKSFFSEKNAEKGAIMRFACSAECAAQAADYALKLYNAHSTVFDHDYDLKDSTQLYCTELVWRAYLHAGIDISNGRRTALNAPSFSGYYLMPSDVYKNEEGVVVYEF
ncbi:MAG: hypothetical protein LBT04_07840 [Prevotellaceae bacterium]|nr:hypothetical protein [Prevotellaceae bacterium]